LQPLFGFAKQRDAAYRGVPARRAIAIGIFLKIPAQPAQHEIDY
jgi:hypothetical protein